MTERQLKYFFDNRIAIEEIKEFKRKCGTDFFTFSNDIFFRKAVERNLEIYR